MNLRPVTAKMQKQIFDILGPCSGLKVLDLFAGTGRFGLECLKRGAISATFIEQNQKYCESIFRAIGNLAGKVIRANVLTFPFPEQYDLIFVDPPYDLSLINPTLMNLLRRKAVTKESVIVIKSSKRENISHDSLECARQEKHGDSNVSFWRLKECQTEIKIGA